MAEEFEAARLRRLIDFDVLDSAPEEAFDRLTSLAADLFDVPIALVSLIDSERQWFKSRHGLEADSTPRSQAFCAHAIALAPGATMVVEDARQDARFADNALVTSAPNIRFYAGANLTTKDGFNLGTLCVIDTKPRPAPSAKDLRRLEALAGIVVDALELRRANRMAAEGQRLLEMAERVSGVGHWRFKVADGGMTWSDEVYRIHGVSREDYDPDIDKALRFLAEDDQARVAALIAEAVRSGQGYEVELPLRRPDGALRHLVAKADCIFDARGQVVGLCGVTQDVTEQKTAQEALAESEARHRLLADNASDIVTRADMEGRFTYVSPSVQAVTGYAPEEILGRFALELAHPDDRDRLKSEISEALRHPEGRKLQHRHIRKDGQVIWVESRPRLARDPATGKAFAITDAIRDITAGKAAEAALAESEARYRLLAENASDVIIVMGRYAILRYVSPSCLRFGYSPDELIGQKITRFVHQDDLAFATEMLERLFTGEPVDRTLRREYRFLRKDGSAVWVEGNPTIIFDAEGRPLEVLSVYRDVSERRAMEETLMIAKAEAEAAAEVKSEFLANMSHELRTPLTSIVGYVRLASEQAELSPLTRTYVGRVDEASRALLCTVNDILDFSKLEAGQVSFQTQPVSLHSLARATLDLFMPQAGAKDLGLTLEGISEADDLVVAVDPDRIRQILLNLVSNGVKFTAAGKVTLRTAYDRKARQLIVEVIDTGAGIPPEKHGSLFKRFSQIDGSLTRTHSGTGLGLAICKGLVEAMGGEIGVTSTLGKGSRFWFKVPAPLASLSSDTGDQDGIDQPTFSGIRVLVVDDHAANRELARLFLTGVGAEVTEAEDGEEAAAMAMDLPYDVILMDIRMPRLDGPGALLRIRSQAGPNDATPVLAFTADADAETAARLLGLGFESVVSKPLEPGLLIRAVARATAFADDLSQNTDDLEHARAE